MELFALTAFVVMAAAGCATTQISGENQGNFGGHIRTPVKDFEAVGLVFTETQLMVADSGSGEGQIFTYQALLKEAQALGADAIINVVMDKKVQVSTSVGSRSTTSTWYGSALAIKYTAILTETGSVTTVAADGATTTTVTTSVYFNDGGGAESGGKAAEASSEEQASAPKRGIRQ